MDRIQIINLLIEKNNYKSYLEVGVRNPNDCFNHIKCDLKHGVDPGVEGDYGFTFKMTSDEFFTQNKVKYDLIFIDGLHIDDQAYRDIVNSLDSLTENGTIVLHDCNPPTIHHAREDYYYTSTPAGGYWNGTTWKAVVHARATIENLYTSVVDTDWGVGIIQRSNNPNNILNDNPFFAYNKFAENRKHYLNLISPQEFMTTYIGEKKNDRLELTWLAKFDDYASMGILSQKILENLNNVETSCKPIIGTTETKNSLVTDLIKKPINHNLGIMFAYPDMVKELASFKNKVIYTGVDSTGGIPNFANNCNKADFLLTPSNLSKKRMIDLGVKKPIHVFPHGIDPEIFKFKQRKKEGKFKFLYVGECSDRKGIFHLLTAFQDLFKDNPNVELHLKSNSAMLFYNGPEVEKIVGTMSNVFWDKSNTGHDEVLKLYEECHAYVYPTRADTFGMTVLEAMACGLPVISTPEAGSTELIKDRYYNVSSTLTPINGHPWMLGQWGEPNLDELKKQMKFVYENYDEITSNNTLWENSNFIRENFSWAKVTETFEQEILPKMNKSYKILTLLTSYNRPHHIKNVINSFKDIREEGVINHVYIVDNSNGPNKQEIVKTINDNIDKDFTLHVAEFNYGQRGALLQMLEEVNIDDYDFIQFSDQDNLYVEKLSTYCEILNENLDITFTTGYMSKEHGELGWRKTRFGKLCEKRSLRAGHMFMRMSDFKKLLPIHLDGQYGEKHNSSWNAGLDWELSYWNKNAAGRLTPNNFVLCVPNGVLHKGVDSTFYVWDVEGNEYKTEELIKLRYDEVI